MPTKVNAGFLYKGLQQIEKSYTDIPSLADYQHVLIEDNGNSELTLYANPYNPATVKIHCETTGQASYSFVPHKLLTKYLSFCGVEPTFELEFKETQGKH